MPTPNLQITHIVANQDQKEVTANAAFDALDEAMNDAVTKIIAGDDALTTSEARDNFFIILEPDSALSASAGFTLDFPDTNKRFMGIYNNTGFPCTVQNSGTSGGATASIADGAIALIYYDGVDVRIVGAP